MFVFLAALCGLILDLILGDPSFLTPVHPVVLMGRAISFSEKVLRKVFPKTPRGEFAGGVVLAVCLPLLTLSVSAGILWGLYLLWKPACFLMQVIWSWQVLAVKDLKVESMRVYRALKNGTLDEARSAVARIVGRETGALSAEEVTKAAVETVAENFSDGVIAPLFYLFLGGAPLALACKAVNTMDSMVGYKNETYLHFGHAPAKLDDAVNYLPSRLAALFLILSAALARASARKAWKIWRRDRRNHTSPNSAQCEAVAAGALEIQLGGPAVYFGKPVEKKTIGDAVRPACPEDIPRICRMLYIGSLLGFVAFGTIRLAVFWILISRGL